MAIVKDGVLVTRTRVKKPYFEFDTVQGATSFIVCDKGLELEVEAKARTWNPEKLVAFRDRIRAFYLSTFKGRVVA